MIEKAVTLEKRARYLQNVSVFFKGPIEYDDAAQLKAQELLVEAQRLREGTNAASSGVNPQLNSPLSSS